MQFKKNLVNFSFFFFLYQTLHFGFWISPTRLSHLSKKSMNKYTVFYAFKLRPIAVLFEHHLSKINRNNEVTSGLQKCLADGKAERVVVTYENSSLSEPVCPSATTLYF